MVFARSPSAVPSLDGATLRESKDPRAREWLTKTEKVTNEKKKLLEICQIEKKWGREQLYRKNDIELLLTILPSVENKESDGASSKNVRTYKRWRQPLIAS